MSITEYCMIANALIALAAMFRLLDRTKERDTARAERDRVVSWARHNLNAIRCKVGYLSPEAVSVCNSLETSMPTLGRVDLDGLERHLMRERRLHNALILDASGRNTAMTSLFVDGYEAGRAATWFAIQKGAQPPASIRSGALLQSLGAEIDRALDTKGQP